MSTEDQWPKGRPDTGHDTSSLKLTTAEIEILTATINARLATRESLGQVVDLLG